MKEYGFTQHIKDTWDERYDNKQQCSYPTERQVKTNKKNQQFTLEKLKWTAQIDCFWNTE